MMHQVTRWWGKTTSYHLLTAFCYISGGCSVTSGINSVFWISPNKKNEHIYIYIYLTTTEKHAVFWSISWSHKRNPTWIQLRDPGACADVENVMKLQQWIVQYQLLWVMRLQANPVSGLPDVWEKLLASSSWNAAGFFWFKCHEYLEIWFERPRKRQ